MTLEELIRILQGFWLGWFLSQFIPLQNVLEKYVKPKINRFGLIGTWINQGLSCHKCLATWSTLIITGNFFHAIAAGFFAYVFEKWYYSMKTYF